MPTVRAPDAAARAAEYKADRLPTVLQDVQAGVDREYEPEPEPKPEC